MFKAVFIACAISAVVNGQSFDVASIHPHAPDNKQFYVQMPSDGHFKAVGAVGRLLVMIAYQVQNSQIMGGPSWFATEKWDIEAKSDNDRHSASETRLMLQNLLKERFSLKIHRETELRPVYILTVSKAGPKFKLSDKAATNLYVSANSISMQRGNIAQMTGVLATALGRPVVDRTGLTGLYDLSVQWDDAPVREGGLPGAGVSVPIASVGGEHGSIFTAVQDQLGLRLESGRAPVEMIVVDGVEPPSVN